MAVAIGLAAVLMVVGGLVYLLMPGADSNAKIDGPKIIAAGHAYTRDLLLHKQPIPRTVSLSELVAHGYLQPSDVAAFQGLDATLSLVFNASDPTFVLMRVHMPDGTDVVLLGDGTAQSTRRLGQ
ncbi:MAG TPA: hypothetical protein VH619_06600 [Verrucomicrobiae bacterium]|jgi:hypothetical protein|nr:hypothetical protein [Verrucomicrobiae bacterium]